MKGYLFILIIMALGDDIKVLGVKKSSFEFLETAFKMSLCFFNRSYKLRIILLHHFDHHHQNHQLDYTQALM